MVQRSGGKSVARRCSTRRRRRGRRIRVAVCSKDRGRVRWLQGRMGRKMRSMRAGVLRGEVEVFRTMREVGDAVFGMEVEGG